MINDTFTASADGTVAYVRRQVGAPTLFTVFSDFFANTGFTNLTVEDTFAYLGFTAQTPTAAEGSAADVFTLAERLSHATRFQGDLVPGHLYTVAKGRAYLYLPTVQVIDRCQGVLADRTPAFIDVGRLTHPRDDHVVQVKCLKGIMGVATSLIPAGTCDKRLAYVVGAHSRSGECTPLLDHGPLLSAARLASHGLMTGEGCVVNVRGRVDIRQLWTLTELMN